MGTLQAEFNNFMSKSFPTVLRGTLQWSTMEVVWHSSVISTVGHVVRSGNNEDILMDLTTEAVDYCKSTITIMRARQVNDFN